MSFLPTLSAKESTRVSGGTAWNCEHDGEVVMKVWSIFSVWHDHLIKLYNCCQTIIRSGGPQVTSYLGLCDDLHQLFTESCPGDANVRQIIEMLYHNSSNFAKQTNRILVLMNILEDLLKGVMSEIVEAYERYTQTTKEVEEIQLKYDVLRSKKLDARVVQLEQEMKVLESSRQKYRTDMIEKIIVFEEQKTRTFVRSVVAMITEQERSLTDAARSFSAILPHCRSLSTKMEESEEGESEGEKEGGFSSWKRRDPGGSFLSKRGYMHIKRKKTGLWKKRWVTVEDGILTIQQSHRSADQQSQINLVICRVTTLPDSEADRENCFRLQSPNMTEHFAAFDAHQRFEWIQCIESNIGHTLRSQFVGKNQLKETNIDTFLKADPDLVCGDCGAERPDWVIANYGLAVCQHCADVHRCLEGRTRSQVRSLGKDVCHPETIQTVIHVGWKKVNEIFLSSCSPSDFNLIWQTPTPVDPMTRTLFLKRKYEDREFVSPEILNMKVPTISDVLEICSQNDYEGFLKLVARGFDFRLISQLKDKNDKLPLIRHSRGYDTPLLSSIDEDEEREDGSVFWQPEEVLAIFTRYVERCPEGEHLTHLAFFLTRVSENDTSQQNVEKMKKVICEYFEVAEKEKKERREREQSRVRDRVPSVEIQRHYISNSPLSSSLSFSASTSASPSASPSVSPSASPSISPSISPSSSCEPCSSLSSLSSSPSASPSIAPKKGILNDFSDSSSSSSVPTFPITPPLPSLYEDIKKTVDNSPPKAHPKSYFGFGKKLDGSGQIVKEDKISKRKRRRSVTSFLSSFTSTSPSSSPPSSPSPPTSPTSPTSPKIPALQLINCSRCDTKYEMGICPKCHGNIDSTQLSLLTERDTDVALKRKNVFREQANSTSVEEVPLREKGEREEGGGGGVSMMKKRRSLDYLESGTKNLAAAIQKEGGKEKDERGKEKEKEERGKEKGKRNMGGFDVTNSTQPFAAGNRSQSSIFNKTPSSSSSSVRTPRPRLPVQSILDRSQTSAHLPMYQSQSSRLPPQHPQQHQHHHHHHHQQQQKLYSQQQRRAATASMNVLQPTPSYHFQAPRVEGFPLMCQLIKEGKVDCMMLDLLYYGGVSISLPETYCADPRKSMVNNLGWTPLHFAAAAGREDYFSFFTARGADKNARCADSRTPLDLRQLHSAIDRTPSENTQTSLDLSVVRSCCADDLELLHARIVVLKHKWLMAEKKGKDGLQEKKRIEEVLAKVDATFRRL